MAFHAKKGSKDIWMAVFLGNPGQKYASTRHNVGFITCDLMAERLGVKINKVKFKSLWRKVKIGENEVIFLKPQTYMNLSGEAVHAAADFFKIQPERIVVIFDDVSLPVGKLRIRSSGSAGGHNGIKSIISSLGSDKFPRIKIGVGSPSHSDYDMADWVLGTFPANEIQTIKETMLNAGLALECLITDGIDKAMNRFN